jgi:hypothetical protein
LSDENFETTCEFDVALLKALCAAQIPLSKLENPVFKAFLENYTKFIIKSESWYRKTLLSKIYTNEIKKKYEELHDKNIYLMFDETTDASGRYILHLLAGECKKNERARPVLFRSVELEKKLDDHKSRNLEFSDKFAQRQYRFWKDQDAHIGPGASCRKSRKDFKKLNS